MDKAFHPIILDMEFDQDIMDAFIEEVEAITKELKDVAAKIEGDKFNPDLYLEFSQKLDRIYGTATTLGFAEIGEYTGALRTVSRQTGNTEIQQAMVTTKKLIDRYFEHYEALLKSICNDPVRRKNFVQAVEKEIKIMGLMDKQIFAFCKDKKTMLKTS